MKLFTLHLVKYGMHQHTLSGEEQLSEQPQLRCRPWRDSAVGANPLPFAPGAAALSRLLVDQAHLRVPPRLMSKSSAVFILFLITHRLCHLVAHLSIANAKLHWLAVACMCIATDRTSQAASPDPG